MWPIIIPRNYERFFTVKTKTAIGEMKTAGEANIVNSVK